jgi:hypothetical protein
MNVLRKVGRWIAKGLMSLASIVVIILAGLYASDPA